VKLNACKDRKTHSHGTECILFIDDEPVIVKAGKQILESLGYDVITRTSSYFARALRGQKT
jgi:CheY-like chemotaxis protein